MDDETIKSPALTESERKLVERVRAMVCCHSYELRAEWIETCYLPRVRLEVQSTRWTPVGQPSFIVVTRGVLAGAIRKGALQVSKDGQHFRVAQGR